MSLIIIIIIIIIIEAIHRLTIAISAYPTCIQLPRWGWGVPVGMCHPVWYGKTRMVWLPDGEKISKICLFVLTWSTNVTDRRTDTAWRHRPRLCIASRGKNGGREFQMCNCFCPYEQVTWYCTCAMPNFPLKWLMGHYKHYLLGTQPFWELKIGSFGAESDFNKPEH